MGKSTDEEAAGHGEQGPSWSARVAALPPAKRALFEALTRRKAAAAGDTDRLADVALLRAGGLAAGDPLVLAHPIGGSLFCYADLCRAIRSPRAIWGVAAGPALAEPAELTIEQLARRYIAVLTAAGVSRPAAVAGWSFGGLLCYEMARQWRAAGDALPLVLLIDTVPWPESVPPWDQQTTLRTFIEYLLGLAGENPCQPVDPAIWRLPVPDALAGALSGLRESGVELGFPVTELTRRYWIYANAASAMCRYRPGGYPGPVIVVQTPDAAAETAVWPAITGGSPTIVGVPGTHYSVLRPPVVESLAQALSQAERGLGRGRIARIQ